MAHAVQHPSPSLPARATQPAGLRDGPAPELDYTRSSRLDRVHTSGESPYCARCKHRFIVQRAVGNGGEYFYWFCRGRQQGLCDMPYIPIDVLEEAVARYYGDVLVLEPEWLTAVREGVDMAVAAERGLPEDLREQ
ncbi:zinc ribbon domain-containing protein [Actinospica durhamensis]|uniref:zinc ribbon domain-containing protein n=1 Tax=Actinospica durhamensis TaxID=1508375 RepID=UPI001FE419C1|nr:zinc ribbon domain-containing protein [Actinospica durhamensis]